MSRKSGVWRQCADRPVRVCCERAAPDEGVGNEGASIVVKSLSSNAELVVGQYRHEHGSWGIYDFENRYQTTGGRHIKLRRLCACCSEFRVRESATALLRTLSVQ
jgi:hypothetical protein